MNRDLDLMRSVTHDLARQFIARPPVLGMTFIVFVCLGNLALGFVLAAHFGHGPPWGDVLAWPRVQAILSRLPGMQARDEGSLD